MMSSVAFVNMSWTLPRDTSSAMLWLLASSAGMNSAVVGVDQRREEYIREAHDMMHLMKLRPKPQPRSSDLRQAPISTVHSGMETMPHSEKWSDEVPCCRILETRNSGTVTRALLKILIRPLILGLTCRLLRDGLYAS